MRLNRRLLCGSLLAFAPLAGCVTTNAKPPAGKALGIQMYALGPGAYADLDATFGALAQIGYQEVEVGEGAKPAAEVRAALTRAGLTCPSIRTAANLGLSADPTGDAARSAEYAHGVGARFLGPSLFPFVRPRQEGVGPLDIIVGAATSYSRDEWLHVCAIMNNAAALYQRQGLTFTYHNHNVDFTPFAGGTVMDFLLANTDPALVNLEVDVGWVAAAGVDPTAFIRTHAARVKALHLKDLTAASQPNTAMRIITTEIGGGVQNWSAILNAARDAGVAHYFVEQEPPFTRPNLESARISFAYLQGLG